MKALGAEIRAFWDAWPPGDNWYNDDAALEVYGESGALLLEADEKYELPDFGNIVWQGQGKPPRDPPAKGEQYVSFESWFRLWKKSLTTKTFVITVPSEAADEFEALCKQRGWKTS